MVRRKITIKLKYIYKPIDLYRTRERPNNIIQYRMSVRTVGDNL